nr:hypothetical protein [uncultured Ralstonia sp.]
MEIDLDFAVKVLSSLATTLLAVWAKRTFEERPRLVSYFGHVAAFGLPAPLLPQVSMPSTGAPPREDAGKEVPTETPGPATQGTGHQADQLPPTIQAQAPQQSYVFSHSVVIRNVGKKTAKNVRVSHNGAVTFHQLSPQIKYDLATFPNGWEILIPTLVPNEQVQIAYLYFPPITVNGFHGTTKSDEGFAQVLNVLPTPMLPTWGKFVALSLFYIGIFATTLALLSGAQWVYGLRALLKAVPAS